jgi:3-phosphoshikimate 1-carboxyvinyltransferase
MHSSSPEPTPLTAERSPWLRGPARVPGEPGLSHLALVLAALARGDSVLAGLAAGPATRALARRLDELGAGIAERGGRWHVKGIGGLLAPLGPLDFSELGEAAPLLLALLAAHAFDSRIDGLVATPLGDGLLDFLRGSGIRADAEAAALRLRGARFAAPLDVVLPAGALALTAPLLVAALLAAGTSILHLPPRSAGPTELLAAGFGARLAVSDTAAGQRLEIAGLTPLRPQSFVAPADPVLAALPAIAALIAPDSEVTIPAVALVPGRLGLLAALERLGGDIAFAPGARPGTADVTVRYSRLVGTTLGAGLAIAPEDRQLLAIAAAFAEGETLIEGMEEGHRRLALTRALRDNGVECEEREAGLLVRGQPAVPGGGKVATRLDPRLAMGFLVLGMAARQPVSIDDGGVMSALFPDFVAAFEHIGASFSQ